MARRRRGSGDRRSGGSQRTPASRTRGGSRRRPPASGWRAAFASLGGLWALGPVLLVAVGVVVLIVASRPRSAGDRSLFQPVARSQVAGRVEGSPGAPVKVIEFADFQCPYCRQHALDVEPALRKEFVDAGVLSIEYRHFVIIGPESQQAAEAAECMLDQGFFWEYHDLLFQRQGHENAGVYSADRLKQYAREAAAAVPGRAFDASRFDGCVASGAKREVVQTMTAGAQQAGLRSTPSFIINGQVASGVLELDQWRQVIEQAKAAAGK